VAYTKVKPSGWAFGEKLTSAQMNLLDTDHSTAIDPTTLSLSGTRAVLLVATEGSSRRDADRGPDRHPAG